MSEQFFHDPPLWPNFKNEIPPLILGGGEGGGNYTTHTYHHGTIIRTWWYVRRSIVTWATQLAGGIMLKELKYFEVMLNIFAFSLVWEIVGSWLVLEPASFSNLLDFSWKNKV